MKIIKFLFLLLPLCSCGTHTGDSTYKSFDYDLQGTWETTNYSEGDSLYAKFQIDYGTIIVSGISEHLKNIPLNVHLEGFSENKTIYVYLNGKDTIPLTNYSVWNDTLLTLSNANSGAKDEYYKKINLNAFD